MKIENGKLVATDEELEIMTGLGKSAADSAIANYKKESGLEDVKPPAGVVSASAGEPAKAEAKSFDAPANENTFAKAARLQQASIAISGGDLAIVSAPKELKTFRYFKAMASNDQEVVQAIANQSAKAIGITAAGDGAALIPVEFDTDLQVAIEDYSLSGMCTNYQMSAAELDLRTVTTKPIVYQVNESIAVTQGAPKFDNPKLYAKAFAGMQTMTKEFFEDNNVGAYSQLVALYAEALAARRDQEIITGTTFTGVLAAVGVQTVTLGGVSYTDITYQKLVELTNKLTDAQKGNGCGFVMHRLVWSVICSMVDINGRPIVMNPWDAKTRTLLGYPVKLTEAAPSTDAASTSYIAFGNLKWVAFGRRAGTTAQILKEGTIASVNLAEQRSLGLVIDERWGLVVTIPGYLAKIVTGA
jgi:HK97 family phage major capsid protein